MELYTSLAVGLQPGQQLGYYFSRLSQVWVGDLATTCFAKVLFPPPSGGGLIEAHLFCAARRRLDAYFRRLRVAASLKRQCRFRHRASSRYFRRLRVAASLKPEPGLSGQTPPAIFPPPSGGGLIEARMR